MTQEEKRIKLAEAQGWRQEPSGFERHGCRIVSPFGVWWHKDKSGCFSSPPDYFNDLNACAEMEALIPEELYGQYVDRLNNTYFERTKGLSVLGAYCSTSEERANAIGRVLGLWKEGE